jgi:TnpA family transposase
MTSTEGRHTSLGEAFAHYGRVFKTLHVLQFLHDESYRRALNTQLNLTEARHALARQIFFGNLGELRQRYVTGMEDQQRLGPRAQLRGVVLSGVSGVCL